MTLGSPSCRSIEHFHVLRISKNNTYLSLVHSLVVIYIYIGSFLSLQFLQSLLDESFLIT